MAQLYPATTGRPRLSRHLLPSNDARKELHHKLKMIETASGVILSLRHRRALLQACKEYLADAAWQAAAEGSPAEARAWLQNVWKTGIQFRDALMDRSPKDPDADEAVKRRSIHSKQVARSMLNVQIDRPSHEVVRAINETIYAAKAVLEKDAFSVTNTKQGPNADLAFTAFARRIARILWSAGFPISTSGSDYHSGSDSALPFVTYVYVLMQLFHCKRSGSKSALGKRLQRALRGAAIGQETTGFAAQ